MPEYLKNALPSFFLFDRAFEASEGKSLAPGVDLLSAKIQVAAHLTALSINWDFSTFRSLCLGDTSLEETFELRECPKRYLAIYREGGDLWEKPLSHAAFKILQALQNPNTLQAAFEKVEADLSEDALAELEDKIQGWFQDWMALGWLRLAD